MTDVIERFMTAHAEELLQDANESGAAVVHLDEPEPLTIKVGDPVIGWSWGVDQPLVWGGPGDGDRSFESTSISFGAKPSTQYCDVTRVAPAGTPLADPKDPRITVVHHKGYKTRNAAYWLPGDWCLSLPDNTDGWFKTKKDAIEAAVRRLAIIDWHATNPQDERKAPAVSEFADRVMELIHEDMYLENAGQVYDGGDPASLAEINGIEDEVSRRLAAGALTSLPQS